MLEQHLTFVPALVLTIYVISFGFFFHWYSCTMRRYAQICDSKAHSLGTTYVGIKHVASVMTRTRKIPNHAALQGDFFFFFTGMDCTLSSAFIPFL